MLYVEATDKKLFDLVDQWFESCQATAEEKLIWHVIKEYSKVAQF